MTEFLFGIIGAYLVLSILWNIPSAYRKIKKARTSYNRGIRLAQAEKLLALHRQERETTEERPSLDLEGVIRAAQIRASGPPLRGGLPSRSVSTTFPGEDETELSDSDDTDPPHRMVVKIGEGVPRPPEVEECDGYIRIDVSPPECHKAEINEDGSLIWDECSVGPAQDSVIVLTKDTLVTVRAVKIPALEWAMKEIQSLENIDDPPERLRKWLSARTTREMKTILTAMGKSGDLSGNDIPGVVGNKERVRDMDL